MKRHDLSNKVLKHLGTFNFEDACDIEIKLWLEEKAGELDSVHCATNMMKPVHREILGLTDEVDDDLGDLVKPQKQSWCEHIQWNKRIKEFVEKGYEHYTNMPRNVHEVDWKFCPICGTPRPTPKPLVERLADVINGAMNDDPEALWSEKRIAAAQAALDFLREHKEEL